MMLPSTSGTAPEPSETNPLGVEPDTDTDADGGRAGGEQVDPDGDPRGDDGQPPVAEDPGPQS